MWDICICVAKGELQNHIEKRIEKYWVYIVRAKSISNKIGWA